MLRPICAGTILCILIALAPASSEAQRSNMSTTTNVRGGEPVTSCDQLQTTFDRQPAWTAEEQRTIPRSSVQTLMVDAPRNGGIYVRGGMRDEYTVTVCKAVAGSDYQFADITLTTSGGRLSVTGPSRDGGWLAYLLIETPRNGSIDLSTNNGPVGLHEVSGTIMARTTNGPISLKDCDGTIDVHAQNGPIQITGGSGAIRVRTQNGPIGVKLTGSSWSGEGLEARAQNGPLSLEVPDRYQSGVELDVSSNSPFKCRGAVCSESRRDWDDRSRSMHFGGTQTRVRLSTVNGPVSVDSRP